MAEILASLSSTPLPTILVVAGIIFLFISVGGQLGAHLSAIKVKRAVAGGLGGVLLICGIGLYFADRPEPLTAAADKTEHGEPSSVRPTTAGEKYRLRADRVEEGLLIPTETRVHLADGQLKLHVDGQYLNGLATIKSVEIAQLEVLAEEKGRPTVLKLSVEKDMVETEISLGEEQEITTEYGVFHGHSLLIQYKQGRWHKQLLGAEPNEAQSKELALPYTDGFGSYPEGLLSIGDSWQFAGGELAELMGFGSYLSANGSATMKFLDVVDYQNEQAALIALQRLEMTGTTLDADGNEVQLSFGGEGRVFRSLSRYVDLMVEFSGTMKLETSAVMEGQKVDLSIIGPVTIKIELK
ncbi:hypothetical protein EZV61_01735 [Corallincola luteus]|uniref:Uncharacterized protein n=1 Tax=Corallincola luteus TaxID=1775177 RepID=A0ABY2ARY0_9GAMM|nr:hypothetical protein [Corallincola luteus]TCI04717.1 hypothetical protein EZV61_01735 [Corallincola luteus]